VKPAVSNYPICGAFEGKVAAGATAEITCKPGLVGRYVIVQLKETEYLTLCEVEVFGSGKIYKKYRYNCFIE